MAANNANTNFTAKKLEKLAPRLLRMLNQKNILRGAGGQPVVEVALLSGRKMREAKQKYLPPRIGGETLLSRKAVDVLAFPEQKQFPHPDRQGIFLGEIYLNAEIAKTNPARGLFLFIHGFLHLLGYGHGEKRDTIIMERLEQKLLEELM